MRSFAIVAAACSLAASPALAQTVSGEVGVYSRYIDAEKFNDVFGNKPMAKLDLLVEHDIDADTRVFANGYMYSGTENPLSDESSEYGFEIGGTQEVDDSSSVTFAAGRYANYAGEGFDAGDWYLRGAVTRDAATFSVDAYSGETDSVALGVSFELPVAERLTAVPGVKYFTAYGAVNPALTVWYDVSETAWFELTVVAPDRDGRRPVFASIGFAMSF